MWIDANDVHTKFIFDLEYVGDVAGDLRECRIWEIGCLCVSTGHTKSIVISPVAERDKLTRVQPGVLPADLDDIESKGVPLRDAIIQWSQWIASCCNHNNAQPALLMSHNCFKSDLLVLMCEMSKINTTFTTPVLFFDTLPFVRYALRAEKRTCFSLDSLSINGTPQHHRALDDCFRLSAVLLRCPVHPSGLAVPFGIVPLCAVDGIGSRTANVLEQNGYFCFRQLVELVSKHHGSTSDAAFTEYLSAVQKAIGGEGTLFVSLQATAKSMAKLRARLGW